MAIYLYPDPKPVAVFSNADGNVFNLMGIAARDLRSAGHRQAATDMVKAASESGSYDNALATMAKWVEIE